MALKRSPRHTTDDFGEITQVEGIVHLELDELGWNWDELDDLGGFLK